MRIIRGTIWRGTALSAAFGSMLLAQVCCAGTSTSGDSNRAPNSVPDISNSPTANADPSQSANQHTSAGGATADSALTADEVVRQFYGWYLGELRAGKEPFKNEEKMKQYVTNDFLREIRERASDTRFDPALLLPNSESSWHDMKVEAGKPKSYKGKAYYDAYVNVTYKGQTNGRNFTDEWVIGLRRTGGDWRIASITISD